MTHVLAGVVILLVLTLVVAAVTRRVTVRPCCSVSDPARDLRIRGGFAEEPSDHADDVSDPRPSVDY
jgi:hypothetical protein